VSVQRLNVPFDVNPLHLGFIRKDIPNNLQSIDFCNLLLLLHHLLPHTPLLTPLGILVVLVVAHADKLLVVVRTRQQDDGDAQEVARRDLFGVWWIGGKLEAVDSDGDGAYHDGIEDLVVLVVVWGADVRELPLEV
jgi:hypothetical protein